MALDYLKQIGQAKESVKTIADSPLAQIAADFVAKAIEEMKEGAPTSQSGTGVLKQSIDAEFESEGQVLTYNFLAADYWDFVNSGVDGTQGSAGAITNVYGSTYSFAQQAKTQSTGLTFKDSLLAWIKHKGLIADDDNYDGLAYVLMRAIKKKGITPKPFVNNALSEEKLIAFETALLDAFENIL